MKSECEELFGHNYGRSKHDRYGDCIHVVDPGRPDRTLCRESLDDVAQACSVDEGRPGLGNGCWTCLGESKRWATE